MSSPAHSMGQAQTHIGWRLPTSWTASPLALPACEGQWWFPFAGPNLGWCTQMGPQGPAERWQTGGSLAEGKSSKRTTLTSVSRDRWHHPNGRGSPAPTAHLVAHLPQSPVHLPVTSSAISAPRGCHFVKHHPPLFHRLPCAWLIATLPLPL